MVRRRKVAIHVAPRFSSQKRFVKRAKAKRKNARGAHEPRIVVIIASHSLRMRSLLTLDPSFCPIGYVPSQFAAELVHYCSQWHKYAEYCHPQRV